MKTYTMLDIKAICGPDFDKFIEKAKGLACSLQDAAEWYLVTGKAPTWDQSIAILSFGIMRTLELWKQRKQGN